MTPLRIYRLAALLLLLLNLGLLFFLFFSRPPLPHKKPKGVDKVASHLTEKLGIAEDDQAVLTQEIIDHRTTIRKLNAEKRALIRKYFLPLVAQNAERSTALLDSVKRIEQQTIDRTYQHFATIKTLVPTNHQAQYADFVENALSRILLQEKKMPPRPRD